MRIPIIVDNPSIAVIGHRIRVGVPLPFGKYKSLTNLILFDHNDVFVKDSKLNIEGLWMDGSVKWFSVEFLANLDSNTSIEFYIAECEIRAV